MGALHETCVVTLTIPPLITKLDDSMFSYSQITDVTLPDNLVTIGELVFNHCNKLTKINFPSKLERIEYRAFYCCEKLSVGQIKLPDALKYIGISAFEQCYGLVGDITIPMNVQVIDEMAFYMCTDITSVTVVNCNTEIRDQAFYPVSQVAHLECIMTKWFTLCVDTPRSVACKAIEVITHCFAFTTLV